jgi:hypothetical protein
MQTSLGIVSSSYQTAIIDYIVDRLDETDMKALVQYLLNKKIDKQNLDTKEQQMYDSMASSGRLILSNLEYIFRDMYATSVEDRYLQLQDKVLKPCPVAIMKKYEKWEDAYVKTLRSQKQEIDGYVTPKHQPYRFKTITRNNAKKNTKNLSTGSVCYVNAKLTMEMLGSKIQDMDKQLQFSKSTNKNHACDIYEIALRTHHPKRFARPYEHSLLFPEKPKKKI